MEQQTGNIVKHAKQLVWKLRGEKLVLTTFWPQDYKRDEQYDIGGKTIRITRYSRAADGRFFEVWGQVVPAASMHHKHQQVHSRHPHRAA